MIFSGNKLLAIGHIFKILLKRCPTERYIKTVHIPGLLVVRPLTYNRTGLLDRPEKAWLQDGGNMRVLAHEVTC